MEGQRILLQIDFQLLGTSVPPKEISSILGMVPDTAFLAGERNPRLGLPRQNLWSVRSRSSSSEVADHWESLAAALNRVRYEIKAIADTGRARITLVIFNGERIPPLTIPPLMAEFAGFVGAEIDIDHLQQ